MKISPNSKSGLSINAHPLSIITRFIYFFGLLAIILLCLALIACASKTSVSHVSALYYPHCSKPLDQALEANMEAPPDEGSGRNAASVTGAVSTAIAMPALRMITGVGIGITAPISLGRYGIQSYGTRISDSNKARTILLSQWLDEIDGNIDDLSFNQAAAKVAMQCYEKEKKLTQSEAGRGLLSPEEIQSRLGEIEAGMQAARELAETPD